jgi:hypothetical protein
LSRGKLTTYIVEIWIRFIAIFSVVPFKSFGCFGRLGSLGRRLGSLGRRLGSLGRGLGSLGG